MRTSGGKASRRASRQALSVAPVVKVSSTSRMCRGRRPSCRCDAGAAFCRAGTARRKNDARVPDGYFRSREGNSKRPAKPDPSRTEARRRRAKAPRTLRALPSRERRVCVRVRRRRRRMSVRTSGACAGKEEVVAEGAADGLAPEVVAEAEADGQAEEGVDETAADEQAPEVVEETDGQAEEIARAITSAWL